MGVRTGGRRGIGGGVGLAAGLLLVAGLAGCGAAGGSSAATATTAQPDAAAVLREFVQCARDNGMPNLPDLSIGADGEIDVPPGTPDPPPSVERACRAIFERLPASARGDSSEGGDADRPPADIQGLLRFAVCMREHGVPEWPDPKADGTFPFRGSVLEREGKSPRMIAAARACKQLNPDPQGRIHGS
jgi:hypothetical protein